MTSRNGPFLLALDQGTTSTRAILFGADLLPRATAQQELAQHFPAPGWVEHEPEEIWNASVAVMRDALAKAGATPAQLAGIGITNQRETVVVWDRATGRAIHRAIVWQDRRTADLCARLRAEGNEALVTERTGLLLDPYFSATKLAWLLDSVPGARARAEKGELCFGTIDSFLLFRLTEGRVHATDATNAARTMLFDIRRGRWDEDLLRLLGIPAAMLPEVRDCASEFGTTSVLGAPVAVRGMAGDQQAATMGQACFAPGMLKSTYGTGCFALLNTGSEPVMSRSRLLTTIAWQLGGERTYALEGAIFIAGATVQWLRDGLGIIGSAAETGALAAEADPAQVVHLVPAFVGLGAPWWDAEARGALFGLTRATGRKEIARAALESVAYQTKDLLDAMEADIAGDGRVGVAASVAGANRVLRVDGGMTASDWTMQFLSDLLGAPVDRPVVQETTALGAAWLAGLQAGLFPPPGTTATHWRLDKRFLPRMGRDEAAQRHAGWLDAIRRTRSA